MSINRRKALGLIGLGAAAAPASAAGWRAPKVRFEHGVASGDPGSRSIVLWTRAKPKTDLGGTPVSISLTCEISPSSDFSKPLKLIKAQASAARDWTVKVEVAGLQPATSYWYRFRQEESRSPVGRFRTLPKGKTHDVVLAVASCALWPGGLFNAYDAIARLDRVDAVVHLGDYIYEYGAAPTDYGMNVGAKIGRLPDPPHEAVTLDDYRRRHAQYKSDPDLQAAHARAAWICAFDDHEICNDPWQGGAENHNPDKGEGSWADRKAAALRAYYEWMPIREPGPGKTREAAYRSFRFGDVASLHMLETRLVARSKQLTYEEDYEEAGAHAPAGPHRSEFLLKLGDVRRRLMGEAQLAWLSRELKASVRAGVTWQLLGNQVVMAKVNLPDFTARLGSEAAKALKDLSGGSRKRLERTLATAGLPMNLDSWDGYPAERERLYEVLQGAQARPLVLSGDVHSFWANELHDAGGRRIGVEFAGGAVSSPTPGLGALLPGLDVAAEMAEANADVAWTEWKHRGFFTVTLSGTAARVDMIGVSTVTAKPYETASLKHWTVRAGDGGAMTALAEA